MAESKITKVLEADSLSELQQAIAEMKAQGWRKVGSINEIRNTTNGKIVRYSVLIEEE